MTSKNGIDLPFFDGQNHGWGIQVNDVDIRRVMSSTKKVVGDQRPSVAESLDFSNEM